MAKEYIDREALFKAIRCVPMSAVVPDLDDTKVYHAVVGQGQAIKKIILAQPVADVAEVRHGEWVNPSKNPSYTNKDIFSDCNVCGFTQMDETTYCPNCGAKMDGDKV